jgi:hypothetical protein
MKQEQYNFLKINRYVFLAFEFEFNSKFKFLFNSQQFIVIWKDTFQLALYSMKLTD